MQHAATECSASHSLPCHRLPPAPVAIATLVTNFHEAVYIRMTEVLGWSLHTFAPNVTRFAFFPDARPVMQKPAAKLRAMDWQLCSVPLIQPPPPLPSRLTGRWFGGFSKYVLLNLTQFERILLLDADTLALQPLAPLLNMRFDPQSHIAAAGELKESSFALEPFPDHFNMGVVFFRPSPSLYENLVQRLMELGGNDTFRESMARQYGSAWKDAEGPFLNWFMKTQRLPVNWLSFKDNGHLGVRSHHGRTHWRQALPIRIIHYTLSKPTSPNCGRYETLCDLWRKTEAIWQGKVRSSLSPSAAAPSCADLLSNQPTPRLPSVPMTGLAEPLTTKQACSIASSTGQPCTPSNQSAAKLQFGRRASEVQAGRSAPPPSQVRAVFFDLGVEGGQSTRLALGESVDTSCSRIWKAMREQHWRPDPDAIPPIAKVHDDWHRACRVQNLQAWTILKREAMPRAARLGIDFFNSSYSVMVEPNPAYAPELANILAQYPSRVVTYPETAIAPDLVAPDAASRTMKYTPRVQSAQTWFAAGSDAQGASWALRHLHRNISVDLAEQEKRDEKEAVSVQTIGLHALLSKHVRPADLAIVKIDVEGGEYGLGPSLLNASYLIDVLLLERHDGAATHAKVSSRELDHALGKLKAHGVAVRQDWP